MQTRTWMAFLAVGLAAFLLAGCGAKVSGVRESKDFKYDDIVKGGMAVGGVFSMFEEQSPKHFNRNATNLMFSIQEEREDYPMTPVAAVRNALGQETFQRVGNEYATDGILSPQTLATLHKGVQARFIVLVRIQSNQVGEPSWSHFTEQRDSRGRVVQKERIHVERYREVKVAAQVYDLQMGKSVWNGLVTSGARTQKDYPITQPGDLQALEMLIRAAQGKKLTDDERTTAEKYPPPGPAPLFQLLPEAFKAFADRLPEG